MWADPGSPGQGPGGRRERFRVDGLAGPLLQLDELGGGRVAGQRTGQFEDVAQRAVPLVLVVRQGGVVAVQGTVERAGEQFGVPVRVAEAVAGDRVTVVPGVAD